MSIKKYFELLKKVFFNADGKFDLYAAYYRVFYYYPFGRKRIKLPKEVKPGKRAVKCTAYLDPESRPHKSFLYASVRPLKWFYWLRKFAFRIGSDSPWLLLPRLTPWKNKGQAKFGLNFTFVEKLTFTQREEIEFTTWI